MRRAIGNVRGDVLESDPGPPTTSGREVRRVVRAGLAELPAVSARAWSAGNIQREAYLRAAVDVVTHANGVPRVKVMFVDGLGRAAEGLSPDGRVMQFDANG